MYPLAAILSILTAVAGWFYLFYSRSAVRLSEIEDQRLNLRRVRLRRFGGAVMLLLAAGIYLGFYAADDRAHPSLFVIVWSAVMMLLGVLVVLALIDVRLTFRLRKPRNRPQQGSLLDRHLPP